MVKGRSMAQSLAFLRQQGLRYPTTLLDALESLEVGLEAPLVRSVRISQLDTSMVLDQDVRARNGLLLGSKGSEVTPPFILRLRSFASGVGVEEPIRVLVPQELPQRQAA